MVDVEMHRNSKRKHTKSAESSGLSSSSDSEDAHSSRKKSKNVSSDSSNDSADSATSKSKSRRGKRNPHSQREKDSHSYTDSDVEETQRSKSPNIEKGRSRSKHHKDGHHHHHHRERSYDVPASYKHRSNADSGYEKHKNSDHERSSDHKKSKQERNHGSKSQDSRVDKNKYHHDKRHETRREESPQRRNSKERRTRRRSSSFDHASAKWGKGESKDFKGPKDGQVEKDKPNFALSGKLTEETNTYRGVVIKYSEPPEARKPKRRWRLYPFKGEKALQTLYIHRESGYLIGRERKVVDIPVDHPSCSKQHAALQYRLVTFTRDDGTVGKRVRPYLIDLDSANGTFINNKKIEPKKYVELLEKDVIKFGYSSREYVMLHENSKDETQDDDVKDEIDEVMVKTEHSQEVP